MISLFLEAQDLHMIFFNSEIDISFLEKFTLMEIKGIASEALDFILEASKSMAPLEFAGLLQEKEGIITEVMILPGTESSDQNAVIRLYMMPNIKAAGSVHSHPGPSRRPSKADLRLFSKTGNCHIIVGFPYDRQSWTCYDRKGNVKNLEVVNVEFKDEFPI
jgi:proteasome lid subunit RPN8/RPN11